MKIEYMINKIVEKEGGTRISPMGFLAIHFNEKDAFFFSGELIEIFDSLISESLKILLQTKKSGEVYSSAAPGILALSIGVNDRLKIEVFEDLMRFQMEKASAIFFEKPMNWLLIIAKEFRDFSKNSQVSREITLRTKHGAMIALSETLI